MTDSEKRLRLAKALWGWEPHDTQRQWLLDESRTKVASCGRRWGKTESAAIDAATTAILRPGSVQMIVSPTYDQSRLISDAVERLLIDSPFTRTITKAVKTPYPRITIGRSVIMARTADEDGRNLRGHSADRVIVDEAAYVRDAVVREVIAPMLADRNGQLVLISTPFGKNHFYQAFKRGQQAAGERSQSQITNPKSQISSFSFPSWANPHISREYIESQRLEMSPRQFAVEYEAQFIDDQSAVFAWEDIEAASVSTLGSRPIAHDCVVAGIDWARYSDYTAVIALAVGESGVTVVGMDRFNRTGWSAQIERVAEFLATHKVTAALADQNSIGDPLLEQLQSRLLETGSEISVQGFTFTNQSKRDLVERLAMRFAQRTIHIPRDEQLMRELQYFEYELTSAGNVRLNARTGFHDDLVIALALGCRQANCASGSDAYLTSGDRAAPVGW